MWGGDAFDKYPGWCTLSQIELVPFVQLVTAAYKGERIEGLHRTQLRSVVSDLIGAKLMLLLELGRDFAAE